MSKVFFSILSLLLFLSCGSESWQLNEDQIQFGWRLSEVISFDEENEEVDQMMKDIFSNKLVSEGFVLHFFPNKTYTELGAYSMIHGKWKMLEDNQIKLGDKLMKVEKIEKIKDNDFLIGRINLEKDLNFTLKFVKESAMLDNFKQDPFYFKNNLWREKPKQKETDEEIRSRLLNYLTHYAYILNASDQREGNVVSFAHSMGIVRVYRGGIGAIPKSKIDKQWINCFYDEEDAMKAYALFKKYLNRGLYKGGTTGSWVKDDYKILMTVIGQIQNKEKEE